MSTRFDGRTVVLVTGAAGAIGQAACRKLSEAGASVVGSDLDAAPDNFAAQSWVRHDVTSEADWRSSVEFIRAKFGRLDCLVNSAGICPINRISDIAVEQWRRVASVNVESILLGIQACLPLLRESGADRTGGSSIVNLSSAAGLKGVPFAAAYCASKGAVTLLTKAAAKEFAALKYPIRVNSVHPGSVQSPMMDKQYALFVNTGWVSTVEEARRKTAEAHPMGRLARPEEVADGIVYLCSSASSFMTGAEFVIDGGFTA